MIFGITNRQGRRVSGEGLALVLAAAFFLPLPAQATAPTTLADLKTHRDLWPAQVTLKVDVPLSIISNGQVAGSITSPAGTSVDLIAVDDQGITVRVLSAQATIPPEQTDLWAQVAALAARSDAAHAASAAAPAAPVASTPANPTPPAAPPTAPSPSATGAPVVLDVQIDPRDNFTKAAFRFWSPAYSQPIAGVIVLVPGFEGDGRGMINSPAWQALAQKYRLALIGCAMQGKGYYEADRGTGDALLDALRQFGEQSHHPELTQAPLLLYGESAGGQFDYDFVLWKPEHVMAFVVNKGAYYEGTEADSHVCSVPGLFFLGQQDSDLRIRNITALWAAGRKFGALWALAPQPGSGHEFSKTAPLAQVFFDAVLKRRLSTALNDDAASDAPPMNAIDENQGWLGDLTTHEIHDASTDSGPNRAEAWLPDQTTAEAWKKFVAP